MSFVGGSKRNIQHESVTSRNAVNMTESGSVSNKRTMVRSGKSEKPGLIQRSVSALGTASISELPRREAKRGKMKTIPIRHTLTSKLRLEKANPLLSSKTAFGVSEPFTSKGTVTPSRRATFQPGMLHTKGKLDIKSSKAVSESILNPKKNIVKEIRNVGDCCLKESKPSFVNSHQKTKVSNLNSQTVKTTQVQMRVGYKGLPSHLERKTISSSTQNKKSANAVLNKTVHTSVWNKSRPLSSQADCTIKRKTDMKLKSQASSVKVLASTKPMEKKATLCSGIQNSQSNKSVKTPEKKPLKSIMRKSASVGDLQKVVGRITAEKRGILSGIENRPVAAKILNKSGKNVAFYSPLQNGPFSPINITNTPPPSVLRKRLEDWLKKRGKSSLSYRHLCCFGLSKNDNFIPPKVNKNSKEPDLNTTTTTIAAAPRVNEIGETPQLNETITLESSDSTFILSPLDKENEAEIENSVPKCSSTPEKQRATDECFEDKENTESLAHPEVLNDLRKLVHLGYPRDQCEQWLCLISKSHPGVKDVPQYWECMAALEEARGDFSSAVDCYGRAIVKGADAHVVDNHLDELWEKFSTLNLSAVQNKRTPVKKLAVDTKHIFKSTVIKFALQQKAVKRSKKDTSVSMQSVNYIVTPVRRSSRKSQSLFRTTPTVKCVNTIEDLEINIRETMEFHGNAVLNPEF